MCSRSNTHCCINTKYLPLHINCLPSKPTCVSFVTNFRILRHGIFFYYISWTVPFHSLSVNGELLSNEMSFAWPHSLHVSCYDFSPFVTCVPIWVSSWVELSIPVFGSVVTRVCYFSFLLLTKAGIYYGVNLLIMRYVLKIYFCLLSAFD